MSCHALRLHRYYRNRTTSLGTVHLFGAVLQYFSTVRPNHPLVRPEQEAREKVPSKPTAVSHMAAVSFSRILLRTNKKCGRPRAAKGAEAKGQGKARGGGRPQQKRRMLAITAAAAAAAAAASESQSSGGGESRAKGLQPPATDPSTPDKCQRQSMQHSNRYDLQSSSSLMSHNHNDAVAKRARIRRATSFALTSQTVIVSCITINAILLRGNNIGSGSAFLPPTNMHRPMTFHVRRAVSSFAHPRPRVSIDRPFALAALRHPHPTSRLFGSRHDVPGNPPGEINIYNEQTALDNIDVDRIERTMMKFETLSTIQPMMCR